MAIFSCSITIVGRSRRRQVCSAAAYQSRCRIYDARQGRWFGYVDRDGEELLASEILLPPNAPRWNRAKLWNEVEKKERRKDAQTARSIRLSLPRELSHAQKLNLLRPFLQRQFIDRGLAVDFAIHNKKASDGEQQPHAHVLVSLRQLAAFGFSDKKDRETLARPALIEEFRKTWADAVNNALLEIGIDAGLDHRSLRRQRSEIERFLKQQDLLSSERNALMSALRAISYSAEPKIAAYKWKERKSPTEIPHPIADARAARASAAAEAEDLLDLLDERDHLLSALNQETVECIEEIQPSEPSIHPEIHEPFLHDPEGISEDEDVAIGDFADAEDDGEPSLIEYPFTDPDDI
jgi:hypothetical protein